MFGKGMMEKLQAMQGRMEEIKNRLETIVVRGEAENGKIIVQINGNRKVKDIQLDPELLTGDKEELEELLAVAVNRAIEQADNVNNSEMQSAAMGMMPGME
jgi:nucleoid-associated protein EbfC|tara:strand:+ start:393 stop:695 length:303 start_codon:yes stop_codon:yes gene_type:complete